MTLIYQYQNNAWVSSQRPLPEESEMVLYLNGKEYVTFLCTPAELQELTLGFLYNTNVIETAEDIRCMEISSDSVSVWLWKGVPVPEQILLRTSGLGGMSLKGKRTCCGHEVYTSFLPEQLYALRKYIDEHTRLYQQTGGIHFSALCTEKEVLILSEDIGRHNTIDKLVGTAMVKHISTEGKWLVTSGRISTEMLQKAAGMGVTLVASLTTPTRRSQVYADELKIVLVGRLAENRLNLYTDHVAEVFGFSLRNEQNWRNEYGGAGGQRYLPDRCETAEQSAAGAEQLSDSWHGQ